MNRAIFKIIPNQPKPQIIEVENKPLDLNFIKSHIGKSNGRGLLHTTVELLVGRLPIVIFADASALANKLKRSMSTIDGIFLDGDFFGDCVIATIEKIEGFECDYFGLTSSQAAIVMEFMEFRASEEVNTGELN